MGNITSILIANRGEIACRIIRTCRVLGIKTILACAPVDQYSMAAELADETVLIDGSSPRECYLNIDSIISLAKKYKADAIHPGYGFLSENINFWDACVNAGVTLIGPGKKALEIMGGKLSARKAMQEAGVPVVPGVTGKSGTDDELIKAAKKLDFPLLVKPTGGGGGKGLKRVQNIEELPAALEQSRREALSSFGNPEVYIEQYLHNGRHIEVQIFGDTQGNVISIGERECSIQRRYQKIIEESPSPAVSQKLRKTLEETAVKAAKAVDYLGAGTVEFILAPDGKFYFLEMNTRLQVEHPVTETRFGIDLVAWQIQVAEGHLLPKISHKANIPDKETTSYLAPCGHAIEARLYAEDSNRDCLPSTGTILSLKLPHNPSVRIDTGIRQGDTVTENFDPMLAKIIAWGESREHARLRLIEALKGMIIQGVQSNRGLLIDILSHPEFIKGDYSTHFMDENNILENYNANEYNDIMAAAAAIISRIDSKTVLHSQKTDMKRNAELIDPWISISGWFS